jgi:hypothetical protein
MAQSEPIPLSCNSGIMSAAMPNKEESPASIQVNRAFGTAVRYLAAGTHTEFAYDKSTPPTSVSIVTFCRPAFLPGFAEKPSQY